MWHNGGWMCIIAFTAISSMKREAHPTPSLLLLFFPFFSFERNLGHMPRGTQSALIHSHLFSLAAISKASLYAQKWFAQAGPSKQLWQWPVSLLWREMTDNRRLCGGGGHFALVYLIWKLFFFHPLEGQNTSKLFKPISLNFCDQKHLIQFSM